MERKANAENEFIPKLISGYGLGRFNAFCETVLSCMTACRIYL